MKAVKKVLLVEDITDDPDHESYARENIFLYVVGFRSSCCATSDRTVEIN
jgi:hypothetical protein